MPPDSAQCLACGATETRVFLHIPRVPVHCNVLWPTRGAAINAPRGEIRLTFCECCGHVFNEIFDPGLMTYTNGYENSLHFSAQFHEYASNLASELIERHNLRKKGIIEIGCGKGDFLRLLCAFGGNRGIGFDPSCDDSDQTDKNITIIPDFYSDRYAYYEADFICCRHVLEHIDRPKHFLSQMRRAIGLRDTVVYFEVPNVLYTLKDLGIWDIIYEHCSYFTDRSMRRLFEWAGFGVKRLNAAFGGQFLCLEAVPASLGETQPPLKRDGIQNLSILVSSFNDAYRAKVDEWNDRLGELLKQGKRVAIWGSGSKGVTFLNILPCAPQIECVVDINPRKQGKFVSGTGQEIVSPEWLGEYSPDTILVVNPIYKSEIENRTHQLGITSRIMVVR